MRHEIRTLKQKSFQFEEAMRRHFEHVNIDLQVLSENDDQLVEYVTDKKAVVKGLTKQILVNSQDPSEHENKKNSEELYESMLFSEHELAYDKVASIKETV